MNNEKRNSNWLTVCLIAIAAIVALIAIFYGVRAYSNNNVTDKNNNQQMNDTNNTNETNNNTSQTTPAVNTFDNVTALELDALTHSIVIKYDNIDKVQVECNNVPSDYTVNLEADGTLHLSGRANANNETNGSIIITFPKDYKLQECDINGGTGTISISDLTSYDFDLDCGTGNVVLANVTFTDTDIDCNTGLLEISGSLLMESDISCHSGPLNLKLTDYNDNYNIKVIKGTGKLTVNGETHDSFFLTPSNASNFIEIEGSSGDISIDF